MRVVSVSMAAAIGLVISTHAGAQASADTGDRILRSFAACREIADAKPRLACFEQASAQLEAAVKRDEIKLVDRADVRKARRSLFGFVLPRIDLFGGAEDFTEINSTVLASRTIANDRVEIRLAGEQEGQVWQTTDPMPFPPRAGAKIRIRKGSLGTYFLSTDGRGVRGMRIR